MEFISKDKRHHTARNFGIDANCAADYVPDERGTQLNFEMMSETVICFHKRGAVPEEYFNSICRDMKKRENRN